MKATILMVMAMLSSGSLMTLDPASAQQAGVTRTDLLRNDLSVPGREVVQVRVDIAPGVLAPNHTHPGEEVAYVCVLYAPQQLPKMRMFKPGGGNPAYNCSEIDVEAPEHAALPTEAAGFTATLRPGDLLFIPAWWFHTFFHLGEFNANVNFWWKPERLVPNQVAARQGFLDAMVKTGFSERAPRDAEVMARIEQAIVEQT
jgi:hypothetical protein